MGSDSTGTARSLIAVPSRSFGRCIDQARRKRAICRPVGRAGIFRSTGRANDAPSGVARLGSGGSDGQSTLICAPARGLLIACPSEGLHHRHVVAIAIAANLAGTAGDELLGPPPGELDGKSAPALLGDDADVADDGRARDSPRPAATGERP